MTRHTLSLIALTLSLPLAACKGKSKEQPAAPPAPQPTPVAQTKQGPTSAQIRAKLTPTDRKCVTCHAKTSPGLVKQWEDSAHAKQPRPVGCYACHKARSTKPDAFAHHGVKIVTVVTPYDCQPCHNKEANQFLESHHAKAGDILASLDNFLGEVVEGVPAAVGGCQQCHGAKVRVLGNGKLDPRTWPNTGIGRINPDGSKGACSACHSRHSFSAAQARQPENCGKCHMGPDHPQIEIYNESKHGIAFRANIHKMNLNSKKWRVGIEYSAAPTCATCHMSATKTMAMTHDVGQRISWTLRPIISTKLKNWQARRSRMKNVCANCHANQWVDNFFTGFDAAVNLYNTKFAAPAKRIMDELRKSKKITPSPFDDKIEWIFFELWHHEGRRARHGAAMMGPDYTQWHGFYEVAKHFYNKFLPEVEKLGRKDLVEKLYQDPQHRWKKGMTKKQLARIRAFYNKRYGQ